CVVPEVQIDTRYILFPYTTLFRSEDDEPFELELPQLPDLPISVAVKELYLGNLDLDIGEQHLPSVVAGLDAQLDFSHELGVQLHQVHVSYEAAHAQLQAHLNYDGQQAEAQLAIADAAFEDFSGSGQLQAHLQGQQVKAHIQDLEVNHDGMRAKLQAEATIEERAAPWEIGRESCRERE